MCEFLSVPAQGVTERTLKSRHIWLFYDLWLAHSSKGGCLVRAHTGALGLVEPQALGAGKLDRLSVHALVEPGADGFIDVVEVAICSVASLVDAFLGLLYELPFLAVYVEWIVAAPVPAVGVSVVIEQAVLAKLPRRNVVLTFVEHVAHLRVGEETIRLRTYEICIADNFQLRRRLDGGGGE